MGFFRRSDSSKQQQVDQNVEYKQPHPIDTHQRLKIKLPEPGTVGTSPGEEWRSIKSAINSSGSECV